MTEGGMQLWRNRRYLRKKNERLVYNDQADRLVAMDYQLDEPYTAEESAQDTQPSADDSVTTRSGRRIRAPQRYGDFVCC